MVDRNRREVEEDRGSSRRSSREDDRGRDRDEGRGRDSGRGRDERGGDRGRDRDERGSSRRSSGSGSSYEYQERSADSVRERASKGANDYDKILKDGVKSWKPNDGDNRIRILPPTWKKPGHFGYDIYVHYGVGPDRGQFLCLTKMLDQPDPINEEREKFKRDMDPESKSDQAYLKDLEAKRRVLVYLIDRDNEKEGVQAWAMPWTVDRDIVKVSVDKSDGKVLPIDHPEDGYDVEFEKKGAKDRTEYLGVAIARRSTPLGKSEWLDYAIDNPLPDQLNYFDYDHIAKAFGGSGSHRDTRDEGRDRDRGSDRDRDGDRNRDRDRDERGGRDRDEGRRDSNRDKPKDLTWEDVQGMKPRELKDLIEQEKLDIKPDEAKDDQDLADWVCEEMKLKKSEERSSSRRTVDEDPDSRLADMRNRRGRD